MVYRYFKHFSRSFIPALKATNIRSQLSKFSIRSLHAVPEKDLTKDFASLSRFGHVESDVSSYCESHQLHPAELLNSESTSATSTSVFAVRPGSLPMSTVYSNSVLNDVSGTEESSYSGPSWVHTSTGSRSPSLLSAPLTNAVVRSHSPPSQRVVSPRRRFMSYGCGTLARSPVARRAMLAPYRCFSSTDQSAVAKKKPSSTIIAIQLMLAILAGALMIKITMYFVDTPQFSSDDDTASGPPRTLPGPGDDECPDYRGSGLTKRQYYDSRPVELYRDLPAHALGGSVAALRSRARQVLEAMRTLDRVMKPETAQAAEHKQALMQALVDEQTRVHDMLSLAQVELASRLSSALTIYQHRPTKHGHSALAEITTAVAAASSTAPSPHDLQRAAQLEASIAKTGIANSPSAPPRVSVSPEEVLSALELAMALRRRVAAAATQQRLPAEDELRAEIRAVPAPGLWSWVWGNDPRLIVKDDRTRLGAVNGEGAHAVGGLLAALDTEIDRLYDELEAATRSHMSTTAAASA